MKLMSLQFLLIIVLQVMANDNRYGSYRPEIMIPHDYPSANMHQIYHPYPIPPRDPYKPFGSQNHNDENSGSDHDEQNSEDDASNYESMSYHSDKSSKVMPDMTSLLISCGSILLILVIVGGTAVVLKSKKTRQNHFPRQDKASTRTLVNSCYVQNKSKVNIFRSGIWKYKLQEDEQWHGPYSISLWYNESLMRVTGAGNDVTGNFIIDGVYLENVKELLLKKEFLEEEQNQSTNSKDPVLIELDWNAQSNQFEGTWTPCSRNNNRKQKFELKYEKPIVSEACENI